MSDNIVVALISMVGALLGALIGAFGTIEAAKIKEKSSTTKQSGVSCGWIGLIASVMAVIGLVLGAIFASSLLGVRTTGSGSQTPRIFSADSTSIPEISNNLSSTPKIQVGPYWGWRNELGTETLMLNILSQGECISSVDIIVDGQPYVANLITNPNDPHYRKETFSFEGSPGTSCNYLINSNKAILPSRYFSVTSATYGINLPHQPPYKWCYQTSDKTWYPCP